MLNKTSESPWFFADEQNPLEVNTDTQTKVRVYVRRREDGKMEARAEIWREPERGTNDG